MNDVAVSRSGKRATLDILFAARLAHETNRGYCKSIGDDSQVPWAEAPQWQRDSAVAGVHFIIENPNALPSATHDSWLKNKIEEGWVWGPVKDVAARQHPCCVLYDDLPPEQKTKDYIFGAVVRAALDL
jgi:hypothetical protein